MSTLIEDHVLLSNLRKRGRECTDSIQDIRHIKGHEGEESQTLQRKGISASPYEMYISGDEDDDEVESVRDEGYIEKEKGDKNGTGGTGAQEAVSRLTHSQMYTDLVITAVKQLPEEEVLSLLEVVNLIYKNLEGEVALEDIEIERGCITSHLYNILKCKLVKGFSRVRHGFYTYAPNKNGGSINQDDTESTDTDLSGKIVKKYITYKDGSTFRGETKNRLKHGYGVYLKSNGDVVEGNWINDEVRGPATLTRKDGTIFEGTWSEKGMCGIGKSITANMTYEGLWKDGRMHGKGCCTYNDGKIIEGIFRSGSLHDGTITDPVSDSSAVVVKGKFHRRSKFSGYHNQSKEAEEDAEEEVAEADNIKDKADEEKKKTRNENQNPEPEHSSGNNSSGMPTTFMKQRTVLLNLKKLLEERLIEEEDYKAVKDSILADYIASTTSQEK